MHGEFIMFHQSHENLVGNPHLNVSDMFPPGKIYKCSICGYQGPLEDFNSTVEGKELCKIRGHWACVRDYYKYVFHRQANEIMSNGEEMRKVFNDICAKAHKEMKEIIKKKGAKNVANDRNNHNNISNTIIYH